MKICRKCLKELNDDLFYKGHAICKFCYIEKVKTHRLENYEHYINYEKGRNNLPKRVEARKNYQQTEKGKEAAKRAKAKWSENNVIKRAAHMLLGNAIRDGKVVKKYECENCGKINCRIHGHHDDYSFPLSVRWLCSKCHSDWHKKNGEGII